jgi:hypothetical protein
VKSSIKAKIAAALARADGIAPPPSQAAASVIEIGKYWKVEEIARQHCMSYGRVYRALQGKPGCIKLGGRIVISDKLYQDWMSELIHKLGRPGGPPCCPEIRSRE